jgi:hypothetical protein
MNREVVSQMAGLPRWGGIESLLDSCQEFSVFWVGWSVWCLLGSGFIVVFLVATSRWLFS